MPSRFGLQAPMEQGLMWVQNVNSGGKGRSKWHLLHSVRVQTHEYRWDYKAGEYKHREVEPRGYALTYCGFRFENPKGSSKVPQNVCDGCYSVASGLSRDTDIPRESLIVV